MSRGKSTSAIFPLGQGLCGMYPLELTGVRARVEPSTPSVIFPSGRWEISRSLWHVQAVVDRSVGHSCQARVISQGKRVSKFPIGAMGKLRHVLSVVDRSVSRSCASVSRGTSMSAIFPSGRWEHCKVSAALTHCVVDQSGCSCASVSRGNARQQLSHRGDGKLQVSAART
jgi:hypothetical protein